MKVEVAVEHTTVITDDGREADGLKIHCSRCGDCVEVFGTSSASVKRGCVMLRDGCRKGEKNFYTGAAS
jgi:hypothetical protein